MTSNVKPVPEGYPTITPSLICRDAAKAIEFYKEVFGATEQMRMPSPEGKILHAELRLGDSMLFLSDEIPGMCVAPAASTKPSNGLFIYVPDVDAVFGRAVAEGSRADMPVADMFWGDRCGRITDPFGYQWTIATHVEDLAPEEIERRQKAFFAKAAGQS